MKISIIVFVLLSAFCVIDDSAAFAQGKGPGEGTGKGPWENYDDHPGKGKGKGKNPNLPVVPEPSAYGIVLCGAMLALYGLRRPRKDATN
jgi:hypothetical protein